MLVLNSTLGEDETASRSWLTVLGEVASSSLFNIENERCPKARRASWGEKVCSATESLGDARGPVP